MLDVVQLFPSTSIKTEDVLISTYRVKKMGERRAKYDARTRHLPPSNCASFY